MPSKDKLVFDELAVSAQAFSEYLHSSLATTLQLRNQKITTDMVKVFTEISINQLVVLTLENCKFEDEPTQKAFVDTVLNYSRLEVLSIRECGLSLDQQFQIMEKARVIQWLMRLDKIELEKDPRAKYRLLLEFELKNICAELEQLIRQPIPSAPPKEEISVQEPTAVESTVGQPVREVAQPVEDTTTPVRVLTQTSSASGSPVLRRVSSSEALPALPSVPKDAPKLQTRESFDDKSEEKQQGKRKETRQVMQLQ